MHMPRRGDVFEVGADIRCFEGIGEGRHEAQVRYSRPYPRRGQKRGRWVGLARTQRNRVVQGYFMLDSDDRRWFLCQWTNRRGVVVKSKLMLGPGICVKP